MEHHGVPINMEIFPQLADKDVWRAVRDAMVPAIDANMAFTRATPPVIGLSIWQLFPAYLEREGILAGWPRLESGKLNMKRKIFEDMSKA